MQVIVRSDAEIGAVADMRGKRVSTSSLNSGTDVLASRMLEAAGLNPDADIQRLRLSLPDTVGGMRAGTVDALFFTGGLPTPGITDLLDGAPGRFTVLPTADLVGPLSAKYGPVYTTAAIPKAIYKTPDDVATIVIPTMLLVSVDMPQQIAYQLTKLLFQYQAEPAVAVVNVIAAGVGCPYRWLRKRSSIDRHSFPEAMPVARTRRRGAETPVGLAAPAAGDGRRRRPTGQQGRRGRLPARPSIGTTSRKMLPQPAWETTTSGKLCRSGIRIDDRNDRYRYARRWFAV